MQDSRMIRDDLEWSGQARVGVEGTHETSSILPEVEHDARTVRESKEQFTLELDTGDNLRL